MATATVITTIRQEIEIPEGADKQAVYNFLAEHQSFRDAFVSVTADGFAITEVEVIDDEIKEID